MSETAAQGIEWQPRLVRGWGMAVSGRSDVAAPTSAEQIAEAFAATAASGGSLALRGSGCSYGDASLNGGGRVLDLTGMRRVLAFDPSTGIATVEPGVTIRDLWRTAIPHGYWPPVVSGTMAVSVGGALGMNIHGKNNFAVGSFGEHVLEFELVTPSGDVLSCSREENADVFHAAISGFGMLGCFTRVRLQLKRVHSGRLRVWALQYRDLDHSLEMIEELRGESDYLVGWTDMHGRGAGLGRGTMHRAVQYAPGEDPEGLTWLDPNLQDVPPNLFKVVPKGWLWPGMWGACKLRQIGTVNALKYRAGFREEKKSPYPQSHGGFHFLLDYVPRWQWMAKPGGLIQFQPFVPAEAAGRVLRELIEANQKAGIVPYLGVLKRHRPDPFLMTHAVDGFSMAMDFLVSKSPRRREALWDHCRRMADTVLEAGGRFYYAKDAVLEAGAFPRIHGAAAVSQFRVLKERLDPAHLLQTDLSRRLFGH